MTPDHAAGTPTLDTVHVLSVNCSFSILVRVSTPSGAPVRVSVTV
jgi:hypothetical protein